ncbi:hypothetical protein [Alicyclobacillus fastidiosus]|uniref:hypothetical protein n=1 Tax=Alicyclobacillus fastidiosus TaxID=392011 RepID=UPI0023E95041|nr:hypothetical protein [Alicyclobacillus fastidiosus]GMA66002.1 hypothetical protein GCM10025859_64440 [Alicyclobacillus fastidiosus]
MNQELAILCEQDQTDLKTQAPLRIERDRERRSRVMEIFQEGGFSEGVDYSMAALIFQHGEKLEDWWTAYQFAKKAVELGTERVRWLGAAAYDRWLLGQGEPIRYGTQLVNFGGIYRLPKIDGKCTNEDRLLWGLASERDQFAMNDIVGMPPMRTSNTLTADNLTVKVICIDRTLVFGDVFGDQLRGHSQLDLSLNGLGTVHQNNHEWRWINDNSDEMEVWWLPIPIMPELGHCIVSQGGSTMEVSSLDDHSIIWVITDDMLTGYFKSQDRIWAVSGTRRNRVESVIGTLVSQRCIR